jgi:hypothetical protein
MWSPEDLRVARTNEKLFKVRSIQRGQLALRGGDFVLNERGEAVTVSFCFAKNSKKDGLTVGHLVRCLGERVLAFSSDTPDANGSYRTVDIGFVVSLNANTDSLNANADSLVFEIRDNIEIEPFRLPRQAGLRDALVIPDWDSLLALPPSGTTLAGFGAQSRGSIGVVVGHWDEKKSGKNCLFWMVTLA